MSRGKVGNFPSLLVLTVTPVAPRLRRRTLGDQVVGLPNIVRGHSVASADRASCCYRGAEHEEPAVLLPGRGHPRLRQREQGAGDPHRSVSSSSFYALCVLRVSHLFIVYI